MIRCVAALLLSSLMLLSWPALAQPAPGHRYFPATALRGDMQVTAPPELMLNGRPERLAPGARIRSAQNMLVMSAALSGQRLTVHYTREATTGLLLDVWVLSDLELANRPWPANPREAASWSFDPAGQSWKKP